MAAKGSSPPEGAGLVFDAMGKNGRDNPRVNVPREYAEAEWSVEDPPSASALKLLLVVIAACGDDIDGEKHFPMSMLREVPGLAHATAPVLEAELRQLMRAVVRTTAQLNMLLGNMPRTSFGVIVSDAALIRAGTDGPLEGFAVRFGETFKQMVRFGEQYAVLDKVAVLAMKSRHSVLLYQWLAFALRAKRIRSLDLPLDQTRRIFGLLRDEYPLFGRLKEKVLTPACAEISELTEFRVTATPIMEGRKAVGVRFGWEKKTDTGRGPGTGGAAPFASSSGEAKPKAGRGRPAGSGRNAVAAKVTVPIAANDPDRAALAALAERINAGRFVSHSEVTPARARALIGGGLVAAETLRAGGFRF